MQLTLRDFLRNTLSGAREDPSVAETAIVIPVGRRTTLSAARKQIDAAFNRIERVLLPKQAAPAPRSRAPSGRSKPHRHRAGSVLESHGSALGGATGLLLGAAADLVPKAAEYVSSAVKSGQAAVAVAAHTARSVATAASAEAMGTLSTARRGVAGTWSSVNEGVAETLHATREESESYAGRAGGYVAGEARDAWATVTHAVEALGSGGVHEALSSAPEVVKAPDSIVASGLLTSGLAAVRKFASNLYATLREWLWGAWKGSGKAVEDVGGGAAAGGGATATPEAAPGGGAVLASASASSGPETRNPTSGYAPPGVNLGGVKGVQARGNLAKNQEEAYAAARAEGLSDSAARALVANFSGESLTNPADRTADRRTGQGIASWHRERSSRIAAQFGQEPADLSVRDQVRASLWEMRTNKEYAKTWAAMHSDASPEAILDTTVRNYERPLRPDPDVVKRAGIMHGFKPAHDPDFYAPKATSTPAPDSTPPPASTAPPPAPPAEPPGSPNYDSGADPYPDHGHHRRKPHSVRTSAGMIVISHDEYA